MSVNPTGRTPRAGTVRRVLEVTGMAALAPIDATVADAEAALS